MVLKPQDIARFSYCPMLPKGTGLVYKKNTFLEYCIGKAIKKAEKNCLLKDSTLTSKKIINAWDNIWWPACSAKNINFKTAQEITVKASRFFLDYCKYDVSGFLYPTVGVDIESQLNIGGSILKTKIDLLKVDLTVSQKNIVLIDFTKKDLRSIDVALDPGIAATALSFYRGKGEVIRYMCMQIDEKKNKIFATSRIFRPKQLQQTRKQIKNIMTAINNGVIYGNRFNCTECKQCPEFKYLMKEDSHLR
jgi:hypothetical protein